GPAKTTALEAAGAKMIGYQDIYASMGSRPLLGLLNASGGLLAYNSPCTGRSLEGVLASQLCRKPAPASGGKTAPKKTLDFPTSRRYNGPRKRGDGIGMNRVKEYRLAVGWSQEELAAQAGCSASYVSRIESGQRSGSINVRVRIAAALKKPTAEVFPDMDWYAADHPPAVQEEAETS